MLYRLVDILFHLARGTHCGLPDERIARGLGVPVDYRRAVREAAGQASVVARKGNVS